MEIRFQEDPPIRNLEIKTKGNWKGKEILRL